MVFKLYSPLVRVGYEVLGMWVGDDVVLVEDLVIRGNPVSLEDWVLGT